MNEFMGIVIYEISYYPRGHRSRNSKSFMSPAPENANNEFQFRLSWPTFGLRQKLN